MINIYTILKIRRKTTQILPLNVKDRNYSISGPSPPSIPRVSIYLCEFMPSYCTPNPGAYLLIFFGHIVSAEGITTNPKKIESVKNWPKSVTVKQVKSFLGLWSYYRKFILNFSSIAKPLTGLTEKDVKFVWSSDCDQAFEKLNTCLVSTLILVYPDLTKPFILDTDVSGVGIGAVLSQNQGDKERLVVYYSGVLTKSEQNYCQA